MGLPGTLVARHFLFDRFQFDSQTGELCHDDATDRLAEQPRQFLVALLERPGELVTREEIRQRLWSDDTFIDFDTGLNSIVRKLREALSDSATSPRFIETIPRRGYRFIAPVRQPTPTDNKRSSGIMSWDRTWPVTIASALVLITVSTFALRRAETRRSVDTEAHGSFLKGLSAASRGSVEGYQDAIVHFERATARQPDFAAAYAALAMSNLQFEFTGQLHPEVFMPKAEAAARKAVELDDGLPEAHAALGLVFQNQWNWQGALREFQRAIDLNRDYAEGYRMYAGMLRLLGRTADAGVATTRAAALDPRSIEAIFDRASALVRAGERDRGLEVLRQTLQKFPERSRVHFRAGAAYLRHGALEEAREALRHAVRLSNGNPRFVAYLAYADAAAGHSEDARRMLADLLLREQREYISPVSIALIHLGLGNSEAAVECVETAFRVRAIDMDRLLSEPEFRPLHGDERVRDVLSRIGLPL